MGEEHSALISGITEVHKCCALMLCGGTGEGVFLLVVCVTPEPGAGTDMYSKYSPYITYSPSPGPSCRGAPTHWRDRILQEASSAQPRSRETFGDAFRVLSCKSRVFSCKPITSAVPFTMVFYPPPWVPKLPFGKRLTVLFALLRANPVPGLKTRRTL